MALGIKFNAFVADKNNGVHNFLTDTLKMVFTNALPDVAVDSTLSDIAEIAPGNGYDAGGLEVSIQSSSQTGGTYELVPSANPEWAATGDVGPFQYVVLYNASSPNDSLICYYDYGESLTLAAADTFTANIGSALIRES